MLKRIKTILEVERGLTLVWESSRRWAILGILAMLALGVFPIATLYLHKLIVDFITEGITGGKQIAISALAGLIVALGGIEILTALFRAISGYITAKQEHIVQDHVLTRLHEKSQQLDLAYYENADYHDTLHLAQEEAPDRTAMLVRVLGQILQNGLSLLAVLTFLMTYHWGVAILLVVAVAPGLAVQLSSAEKLYQWRKKATAREREAAYYHSLITAPGPAKEMRVFDIGRTISGWARKLRRQLRSEKLNIQYWRLLRELAVQIGTLLAQYSGYFYFAYQTARGIFTLGDMVMFFAAFFRAQNFLRELLNGVTGLYESNLFIENMSRLMELSPTVASPPSARKPSAAPARITFRNVGFSYPGTARKALQGLSLRIDPGTHIAIVGKNGSGKSTFVKLLCRLYDCTEGTIELNGDDIRELDLDAYRRQFSVLFQDYLQFELSVEENVRLGDILMHDGEERIADALRLSGAEEVVASLPHGVRTMLGKLFKNGEQLSQGEWQKIALARTLVRNAPITVLDEPTSWMDPEAEYRFFQRFHDISAGKTAIMISHRLSTVRMADQILVMDEGRICESGTHDALMRLGGRYADLFNTQAKNYQ